MKKIFIKLNDFPLAKLLLLCGLILLATGLIVFGPMVYKNYQEKIKTAASQKLQAEAKSKRTQLEAKIAVLKKWHTEDQLHIGAKEIRLQTKWQDGELFYKFEVDLTDGINDIRRNRNSYDGFTVNFLDSDGFKIFSFKIPLRSMTGSVNEDGAITQLSINDSTDITAEEYLKLAEWSMEWNF